MQGPGELFTISEEGAVPELNTAAARRQRREQENI